MNPKERFQGNQGGAVEDYVAYCGLDCTKCSHFESECDGCLATSGQHWCYVHEKCKIRPCVMEKGYSTCAQCPDYICDKLETITSISSCARDVLNRIRDQLHPAVGIE